MEAPKNSYNSPAPETKLHFLDYWRIIRIRKTVILAVFLLVLLTTTAVTFIMPETYMSTARIEVGKDIPDITTLLQAQNLQSPYDPYFIQTEFEKIKSQKVLTKVIEQLHLQSEWGKRYGNDNLKIQDAYKILVSQIDLRQSRNTSLIEIRAFSDVKKEAADIANKIAEVYKEVRQESRQELSVKGIAALKEEYQKQKVLVEDAQQKVDKLRVDLGVSDSPESFVGSSRSEIEAVLNKDRDRVQAEAQYIHLEEMLTDFKSKSREELKTVIPIAYPSAEMDRELSELHKAEQQYASMIVDYSLEHPDVQRVIEVQKTISKQIEDQIDGVLMGLETKVKQVKALSDKFKESVDAAKKED